MTLYIDKPKFFLFTFFLHLSFDCFEISHLLTLSSIYSLSTEDAAIWGICRSLEW